MTRMRLIALFSSALALAGIGTLAACGARGFDPQSKVDSVRLFAVRADKPYAKPGETVTLEALFTDARRDKPRPLHLYWIPIVCMNPRSDLYYLCFAPQDAGVDGGATFVPGGTPIDAAGPDAGIASEAGADAGTDGGAASGMASALDRIPEGVDLGPFLPQGNTFSFRMPDDAVQPREGVDPYGIAIVFNVACAGRLIRATRDPSGGPQQVPLQCVDENNQRLPPSDYVIGISRVYAYTQKVNTNPVIEKVTFDGLDVDLAKGISVPRCVADRRSDCQEHEIDIRVSDASWEDNPNQSSSGVQAKEQIWAAYYSDQGDLRDDARLLFDTRAGRITDSQNKYQAPYDPADGTIWAVVHDNRGGASWVTIPLHVN